MAYCLTWASYTSLSIVMIFALMVDKSASLDKRKEADSFHHNRWNITTSYLHVSKEKYYMFLSTDAKNVSLLSSRYRCHFLFATPVCNKLWQNLGKCTPQSTDNGRRFQCELNKRFARSSVVEIEFKVLINNTTLTKYMNVTVEDQQITELQNLRGVSASLNDLVIEWENPPFPESWIVQEKKFSKTVQVTYWKKGMSLQRDTKTFKTTRLFATQVRLGELEQYTSYCFKARYQANFDSVIPFDWTKWSDVSCGRTLGVPGDSIRNSSCWQTSNGSHQIVELKWKFPPPVTFNGYLIRMDVRLRSPSHRATHRINLEKSCTNCSSWFHRKFPFESEEVPSIGVALCSRGGCGFRKTLTCAGGSPRKERVPEKKQDSYSIMAATVVLAPLMLAILIAIWLWKRSRTRTPGTNQNPVLPEVIIIDPRQYELPPIAPSPYCVPMNFTSQMAD